MTNTNGITFKDVEDAAKILGAHAGTGKDTQVKMGLKLLEGSYHQALDLAADKHDVGVDDAVKLAELYVKAQGTATAFDAKAPNQRKLASTFRTCIKGGMWSKGGTGEPIATTNQLMNEYQKLRKDPATAKGLDDAFNVLMRYLRTQLKRDQLVPLDELKQMCLKPSPKPVTSEQYILGIAKQMDHLIKGTVPGGMASDASGLVVQARECMMERLRDIAKAKRGIEVDDETGEEIEGNDDTLQETTAAA